MTPDLIVSLIVVHTKYQSDGNTSHYNITNFKVHLIWLYEN